MEIYHAIQGEGTKVGESSVFIRLFGCNLLCVWCDTKYSINMELARETLSEEEMKNLYTRYTPLDLAHKVLHDFPFVPNVVVTGGEPTTHLQLLLGFGQLLRNGGKHVTVETNGTIMPDSAEGIEMIDLWSVSAKLAKSQATPELEKKRLVDWERWSLYPTNTQFKFVITNIEDDLQEILGILNEHPQLRFAQIILVPNGDIFLKSQSEGWDVYKKISALTDVEEWRPFNSSVKVLPQLHLLADGRARYT